MSNDDKLKVRQNVSKKKAFKELTIIRDTIFWIDVVAEGQNENAIFARPFNVKDALQKKLKCKNSLNFTRQKTKYISNSYIRFI